MKMATGVDAVSDPGQSEGGEESRSGAHSCCGCEGGAQVFAGQHS